MNVLVRWWSDREVDAIRRHVQERLPITSDGVRKVLHAAEAIPAADYKRAAQEAERWRGVAAVMAAAHDIDAARDMWRAAESAAASPSTQETTP